MESSNRRLFTAAAVSMLLLVGWSYYIQYRYPLPPPATQIATPADTTATMPVSTAPVVMMADPGHSAGSSATQPIIMTGLATTPETPAETQSFQIGIDQPVTKRDAKSHWVALNLTTRGASIDAIDLTEFRNNVPQSRTPPPETYDLLRFLPDPSGSNLRSFSTPLLQLVDLKQSIDLRDVQWTPRTALPETVAFEAIVQHEGQPLLKINKQFHMTAGSYDLKLSLEVQNLSDKPLAFALTQEGPINLRHDAITPGAQTDDRVVVTGLTSGNTVTAAMHPRSAVMGSENHRLDFPVDKVRWLAHANKWFAVIMAPVEPVGSDRFALKVARALAFTRTADATRGDDLQIQFVLQPGTEGRLPAGASAGLTFDTYVGPKDHALFVSDANPTYVARNYDGILDATGGSCAFLTFHWLTAFMRWLLKILYTPLRNYGVAIIVMVIIVRAMLHKLTKNNQVRMMRMQKAMQRLAPRIEAIKAKYPNDPMAVNRETMEVYREEGVNPFGQMAACVPMLIQMPIWIALWTTLNTTIDLRHEPFMLWIRDLAAPDALIKFNSSFGIPLLQTMMGPISALNVLPLVMGLTMYLQQKLTQKLTRPDGPPPATTPSADGRPSAADQMRQQQMMMNFMSVFMALMFYNFPCGLNLYIFTSNLFGMLEQWIIRKEIHAHDLKVAANPALAEAKKARKTGPMWLESLRQRLHEAQQIAEQSRREARGGGEQRPTKNKPGRK